MTIDGKNLYNEWGCTLLEGSFDDLLKYPKRKSLKFRNWAEIDGIIPDLTDVEFESRKVKLSFLMEAYGKGDFWQKYHKLVSDLSSTGYREMNLIEGMTHRLRLDTGTRYELPVPFGEGKNCSPFDLDFIEDDFERVIAGPAGGISLRDQLSVNGYDFGAFGIGCDDNLSDILKLPALKTPFTDGRTVDLSTVRTQHQTIKLSLWMLAGSVSEFINNYHAFFTQIAGTGTQSLYINTLGTTLEVYYSDCTSYSVEIWRENDIMVRFTISLVIPVVSWVDTGGIMRYTVLEDKELGVLTDEQGRIITF